MIAGFTHSLFANQPVVNILLLTATTALEAATGAWLIRRIEPEPGKFNKPRHVFNLIAFSALASTAISAMFNTTVCNAVPGVSYWASWRLTDQPHVGVLVMGPLVLLGQSFVSIRSPDQPGILDRAGYPDHPPGGLLAVYFG